MLDQERKMQIRDISVTVVLIIIACILGKVSMNHFGDTWIVFNGPTLGTLTVGGLLWLVIRKRLIKK